MAKVRVALLVLDVAVVAAAACASVMLRDPPDQWAHRFLDLRPYLVFSLIAAAIVLPVAGTSRDLWRYASFNDFLRIMLAAVVIVLAASSGTFAYNRLVGLARTIPLIHVLLIIGFMCGIRVAARLLHGFKSRPSTAARIGDNPTTESVLLVGDNAVAELFIRAARELGHGPIHVAGVLSTSGRHKGRRLQEVEIMGEAEELPEILRRLEIHGVDVTRIAVAVPAAQLSPEARELLQDLEGRIGILVDYLAERLGFTATPGKVQDWPPANSELDRLPALRDVVVCAELQRGYWPVKRLFDFVVVLAILVVAVPLMLIVAVLVALDVGNPVLFWQERWGRFGRRLRLYKFRTMRPAHDTDGSRIEEARRTSRIGNFLRKTRLDELPQLFHILLGEMSFVGPRPLLASEQSSAFTGRLAVRPGLTGWAQVHGGRLISVDDKAAMDLWYIRNASFQLDFVIALKTVRMVLNGDRTEDSVVVTAWREVADWKAELQANRRVHPVPRAGSI
ncbi:sugar transferase [Ancylobacter polymorphus]|uniref:Sugar transferase n=1 Tax=Ancylobacter polymorphus TaxID=223390 RepID=A0A9E7CXV5_9HYPH|nr:sugar transferase [Ancylobacter polymorphus]UOK72819.1 sugar transferase [Ancylobacter polymorphus]